MTTKQEKELRAQIRELVAAGVSSPVIARRLGTTIQHVLGVKYREVRIASINLAQPYSHQTAAAPFNPDDEGGGLQLVHLYLPKELVAFAAQVGEHTGQSAATFLADVLQRNVFWRPSISFRDAPPARAGGEDTSD